MTRACLPILSAVAMTLASIPAVAQMVVSAKSGVVNFTEGQVLLDNQAVESSVTRYPEMKENAVLRTEAGRVEVLLTPGTILRMGENSTLKLITNRLVDTRVELQSGSAVIEAVQTAKDNNVTVVVKNGAASIAKAGIYRFDTEPAQVKVFRGEAAVEMAGETIPVGAGRMLMLDGSSAAVTKFNAEETDSLDHWSKQRGGLLAMANPSTAKSVLSPGYFTGYGGVGGYDPFMYGGMYGGMMGGMGCNPFWGYNSWYAMYTYVPCSGYFMSPYGFSYFSPRIVGGLFSHPPVGLGAGGARPIGRYYPTVSARSIGNSGIALRSGAMGGRMGSMPASRASGGGMGISMGGTSRGGGGGGMSSASGTGSGAGMGSGGGMSSGGGMGHGGGGAGGGGGHGGGAH